MTGGVVLGSLALTMGLLAAHPPAAHAQEVITADELRRAGVMRLGDVLLLANQWDLATIDGVTWQVSPGGLAPLANSRVRVLVDGQPIDLDLFGTLNLTRFPVPLYAIDSIEVIDAPRLVAGELVRGMLHIHTRRPQPGPSAQGWFTTGSEIGDPGPFAFTPRAGANVDRFGHDGAFTLAYGGRRWWTEASLNLAEGVPTDPAIITRYAAVATRGRLRIEATAPAVRLGAELGGRPHELVFRASRLLDYYAPPLLGRPLAAVERFAHLGFTGSAALGRTNDLRYYVTRGVNRSDPDGAGSPRFEWRAVTLTAGLEMVRRDDAALRTAGVRFRRVDADAPGLSENGVLSNNSTITAGSAYGELRVGLAEGIAPEVKGTVTLASDEVGVAAAAAQRWTLTPRSQIGVDLSYTRRTRAEDESIWAWTERGYTFLEDAGIELETGGALRRPEEIAADLTFASDLASDVQLRIGGEWRAFAGLALARQRLRFVSAIESFEGPTQLVTGARGQVAGVEAGVTARRRDRVRAELVYRLRGAITGGDAFRDAWATIPRHIARATLEYNPVASLGLWASLTYRSRSHWPDYQDVEAESDGKYRGTIPAAFTVDLAIQKWFWERRLRANLGLRNITDAPLRYHPAGATWAPAFVVQIEARAP